MRPPGDSFQTEAHMKLVTAMSRTRERNLTLDLERWVAQGLLSADQAARIQSAESAQAAVPPGPIPAPRRIPIVVEALGYVGGALTIAAGVVTVKQLWPGITETAEMGLALAGTVLLSAAGGLIHPGTDPALGRVRSVLWALSTACLAAFLGLLVDLAWNAIGGNLHDISIRQPVFCAEWEGAAERQYCEPFGHGYEAV